MAPINLNPGVATILCGAVAAYVLLWSLLHLTQGRDEPPAMLTSVPFVRPILGSKFPEEILNLPEPSRTISFFGPGLEAVDSAAISKDSS